MDRLMPIVKEVIVSGLIAQATSNTKRHNLASMALLVLAIFSFTLAIIFGSLAFYYWVGQYYSQPVALALTSAGLVVDSAVFLYIGYRIFKSNTRRSSSQSHEKISKLVDTLTDNFSEDIVDPVKENPKTALAAAAIAGFLAGDHIH